MERLVAPPPSAQGISSAQRRGVILLVILSLLTLFMMLGVAYLAISTRARATARAFAIATNGSRTQINATLGHSLVEEAFLSVVRGATNSTVTTGSNSLLGDKYGTATAISGTLVGSATGSLVVAFTATVSGTQPVEQLNGRVLTFQTPGLTSASVRILRAEPATWPNVKLFVPDGPTQSGASVSASSINAAAAFTGPHFIVNGREFTSGTSAPNEGYDAYDDHNDFLANPLSPASRPSFSVSGALGTSGINLKVDNDGDGTLDSGWIDVGLPPFSDASGNLIYPKAAILVTDLDGRLNVNAHGSRAAVDYGSLYPSTLGSGTNALTGVTTSTSSFASTTFSKYPDGLGFGPAEVSLEQTTLFSAAAGGSVTPASSWRAITEGVLATGTSSDPNSNRPPASIGPVEGRYGSTPTGNGVPGRPNFNDPLSSEPGAWIASAGFDYFTNPGRYGSPPDVRGRMKVFVDDYGQPVYYKPYWSGMVSSINHDEVVDDPYEVNLLRMGSRPGWLVNAPARNNAGGFNYGNVTDNLFTAAELEAVLRIFDPDARSLPQRLNTLSGTQATANRLLLTTDSWDSSAMTGGLRDQISTLITSATTTVPLTGTSGTSAYEMFAPETLMGHKFDLNRPFHDSDRTEPNDTTGIAERQKYAKHLYSLLYVISGSGTAISTAKAQELAQWAVNVVDFRDRDSVMTGFEYDKNLTNGWNVDGLLTTTSTTSEPDRAVVWGCERPEIVVTETVCWHDRQTDDDVMYGSGKSQTNYQVVTSDTKKRDDDFDQKRRPQGAFFFELYSPWSSQLAEYDPAGIKAVRRQVESGTSSLIRAEPIPVEIAAGSVAAATSASAGNALGRFDSNATLSLSGTAPGGYPVWRIITVKSGVGLPTVTDPVSTISGTLWRSVYFTQPPVAFVRSGTNSDIASGTNAVAFWPAVSATSTITLSPKIPKVFGTGSNAALGAPAATVALDTIFLSGTSNSLPTTANRPLTLTEPLITSGTADTSYDPYAVLHTQTATGTASFPLATVNDSPLDNLTYAAAGIVTQLTGTDSQKTLFQNGRHSNYFLLHLQRLANPSVSWNANTNPYVTIDTMPIDLLVYNTGSTGFNYDEPTSAPDSFTYTFNGLTQRNYDDGEQTTLTGTAVTVSLERGNTQTSGTTDRDIWSARINTSGTTDATKLLSIQSSNPSPPRTVIDWSAKGDGTLLSSGSVPSKTNHSLGSLAIRFSGTTGSNVPNKPFPWLFWANRPFASPAELTFVPKASPFDLLRLHATASGTGTDKLSTGWFGHLPRFFERTVLDTGTTALASPWDVLAGRIATSGSSSGGGSPSLWDAVHVPTPYAGGYATLSLGTGTAATTSGSTAMQPLALDKRPFGQLPSFREPGRINVNTITGSTTWLAALGSGTQIPTSSGSFTIFAPPNKPATSLTDILQRTISTSGTTYVDSFTEANRDSNANAFFRYQTVNRVANSVTTRSSVFAVWVTIGFFDAPGAGAKEYGYDTGVIQRYRGFYVYDRSLPVGFSPGKDYNVRDAILLRRLLP